MSCTEKKGKEIAIVGASFSSEKRNIPDCEGELLPEGGEFIKSLVPEKV